MSNVVPVFHGGRTLPSDFSPYSDRPLSNPNSNPIPTGPNDTVTAGNAQVVWGTNGDRETATATITNNQNQIVGQVNVDDKNKTVSVTKYDPHTGKPETDAVTGKPLSSTFHYDDEGNLVNDGNLPSQYSLHVPYEFDEHQNHWVTLQDGNADTRPISVDIAPDLLSTSRHTLRAEITMTAKPSSDPDDKVSVLFLQAGGVEPDGAKIDQTQLIADYSGRDGDATYVSPEPPVAHSWLHEWFPGLP